uniref:Uncharacterized protein n=1 Tax=Oryza sativa subsp. japonica TaxID=39947 RepID=Q2QVS1_ORYSJ|nr:hypothetical protein LOC_Os12g11850 [Oryza sativa Japonica Group]
MPYLMRLAGVADRLSDARMTGVVGWIFGCGNPLRNKHNPNNEAFKHELDLSSSFIV